MADNFVGHDFAAKTFPFQQPVGFPLTSFSGVPWGQAIVNEVWESQVIGAGDTGTINLDIQVPNDYVSLLRTFHLQAYDQAAINWSYGAVGLAYQNPGGPYKDNISELPESQYLWWQLFPGTGSHRQASHRLHSQRRRPLPGIFHHAHSDCQCSEPSLHLLP